MTASNAELWCFLCSKLLNKQPCYRWFETQWLSWVVIVMELLHCGIVHACHNACQIKLYCFSITTTMSKYRASDYKDKTVIRPTVLSLFLVWNSSTDAQSLYWTDSECEGLKWWASLANIKQVRVDTLCQTTGLCAYYTISRNWVEFRCPKIAFPFAHTYSQNATKTGRYMQIFNPFLTFRGFMHEKLPPFYFANSCLPLKKIPPFFAKMGSSMDVDLVGRGTGRWVTPKDSYRYG